MRRILFFNEIISETLNFKRLLKFFYIVFFDFFFPTCFFSAQYTEELNKLEATSIVLKDVAQIYSADDIFNDQIVSYKVILKNSDLSYSSSIYNTEIKIRAVAKNSENEHIDIKFEAEASEGKKLKITLKRLKKEIDRHEKQMRSFLRQRFSTYPTSEEFLEFSHFNKEYVASCFSLRAVSKIHKQFSCVLKSRLNFSRSQKYTCNNSKSLACSFFTVFSIRPPPLIV